MDAALQRSAPQNFFFCVELIAALFLRCHPEPSGAESRDLLFLRRCSPCAVILNAVEEPLFVFP